MNEPIIRIDQILLDARYAAEAGHPQSSCPHLPDSIPWHRWMDAYNRRVSELAQQKTAA